MEKASPTMILTVFVFVFFIYLAQGLFFPTEMGDTLTRHFEVPAKVKTPQPNWFYGFLEVFIDIFTAIGHFLGFLIDMLTFNLGVAGLPMVVSIFFSFVIWIPMAYILLPYLLDLITAIGNLIPFT